MKPKQIMLFIFIIILISVRCDTTEPPPSKASLSLTLEDVSCTEVWIKLTTTNLPLPTSIVLKQNDAARTTINLTNTDTMLYVDSLLPKQTYVFQATSIQNPASSLSSNQATATTLDTTSHNFTWQTFVFGQHSSSVLYDVAIINENNIWAVGEIYLKDSLGNNDPHAYNAVHWDGNEWKLHRIIFYTFCPQGTGSGSYPASSIFAFDNENIVVSSGSQVAYLKNGLQIKKECVPVSVNKIWGTSISDFYIVGYGGGIAHYQNGAWSKITSGTTVDLLDVWGSPDGSIVWVCGYYDDKPGTYLLRSRGGNFEIAYDGTANRIRILSDTISGRIITAYTLNSKKVFIGTTSGVYNARSNTKGEAKRLSFTPGQFPGLPFRLRGTGLNDFTIAGEYSFIAHYNGFSWRYFSELWTDNTRLRSVAQKNDIIVAVGSRYISPIYSPAVIYVGKR